MKFSKPKNHDLPVKPIDAIDAFKIAPQRSGLTVTTQTDVVIGWVMPPPSAGSGGHQNMFRFIKFAETAGYRCRIYFYLNGESVFGENSVKEMMRQSGNYPEVAATMEMFERDLDSLAQLDAIFASSWETAYAVQVAETKAKKLYFVQDYEPLFYPAGSRSILAEKTYDFGFTALTAGAWLAKKLQSKHGMEAYSFDFAIDRNNYFVTNPNRRDEIFFYARPSTERRGYELGLLALWEVMRERPNTVVHFAGERVKREDVPFNFISHGTLTLSKLRELYNRCGGALVISTTNMSLLPLELLACGVVPVVNQGENNSLVTSNENIAYVEESPLAMAAALIDTIQVENPKHASPQTLNDSVREFTWDDSGKQFLSGLARALHG